MRRRLLTGFLLLDGLCAVLAAVAAPGLLGEPNAQTGYVEIAGTCVEEVRTDDESLAGRPVPMAFCTAS